MALALAFACLLAAVRPSQGHDESSSLHAEAKDPDDNRIRKHKDYYVRPGVTSAELLRARGYVAREYYFKTEDGYVLEITRGTNPLFNGGKRGLAHKKPILFVHGSVSSAPIWLLNSKGARPQDFTKIKLDKMGLHELNQLIGHYDSARSMPMLAMNFGYECWLLNRRGFSQSEQRAGHLNRTWHELLQDIPQTFLNANRKFSWRNLFDWVKSFRGGKEGDLFRINKAELDSPEAIAHKLETASNLEERQDLVLDFWLSLLNQVRPLVDLPAALTSFGQLKRRLMHTFDSDYWNFSFDQQAKWDFPQAIEFVLRKTGHKQVNVITHSAAAPLSLMSLSIYPNLAHKIHRMLHWSSCTNTGTKSDIFPLLSKLEPMLQPYIGPIPYAFMTYQLQSFLQNICKTDLVQRTLCATIMDSFFGRGERQQPVTQFILANILQPTSTREILHMFQMVGHLQVRHFKFSKAEENIAKYGHPEPPAYDYSNIRLRNMWFHVGVDDRVSSHDMVKEAVSQLSVPYKLVLVNETGVHYNHAGAFLHDQTTRLTNLPSMLELEKEFGENEDSQSVVWDSLGNY